MAPAWHQKHKPLHSFPTPYFSCLDHNPWNRSLGIIWVSSPLSRQLRQLSVKSAISLRFESLHSLHLCKRSILGSPSLWGHFLWWGLTQQLLQHLPIIKVLLKLFDNDSLLHQHIVNPVNQNLQAQEEEANVWSQLKYVPFIQGSNQDYKTGELQAYLCISNVQR